MGEKSGLSPWRPYLYPYKAVVVIALAFLLLQGIAEFIRNAYRGIAGEEI
jgi:TRAP-type mannitol/chloroaromatic compound transport system permease small subunit